MNLDQQIREALRSSVRPVDPVAGYRAVQSRLHDTPRRQTGGMRMAIYACLAAVIVAAVAVGTWQVVRHLSKDQSVLVITDDSTGMSPGPAGQTAQSTEGQVSSAMFRGDLARTGVYPDGGPVDEPELLWKFKTGEEEGSSPVVADGVVYVGDGYAYLYALDAQSGEPQWKSPWPTEQGSAPPCPTSPTVSEGVVYIADMDGYLSALDAATGRDMWRFQTGDYISASPVVFEGVVYIGSWDGCLYALDAQTGQQKWKFQVEEDEEGAAWVTSAPAISDGVLYLIDSAAGSLYALDAATGQEIWTFGPGDSLGSWPDGRSSLSSPAVSDGVVYFANHGYEPNLYAVEADLYVPDTSTGFTYLYALDAQTGREKWIYKTVDGIRCSPAVFDGVVYYLNTAYVAALDTLTGKTLWRHDMLPNDGGWGEELSAPSISGEVLYFGTVGEDGRLNALDVRTGIGLWTWVTTRSGYPAQSSPAIWDGVIYFSANDGYLCALK